MPSSPSIEGTTATVRGPRRADRAVHNALVVCRYALTAIEVGVEPFTRPEASADRAASATASLFARCDALDGHAGPSCVDRIRWPATPCNQRADDVPLNVIRARDQLAEAEELLRLLGALAGVGTLTGVGGSAGVERRAGRTGGEPSALADIRRLVGSAGWYLDRLEVAHGAADWTLRLQIRRVLVGSTRRSQPSVIGRLSRAAAELSSDGALAAAARTGGRRRPGRTRSARRIRTRRCPPVS